MPGLTLTDCRTRQVMPSDRALSSDGLGEADRIMAAAGRRRIVILGGSHSAYVAAGRCSGCRRRPTRGRPDRDPSATAAACLLPDP